MPRRWPWCLWCFLLVACGAAQPMPIPTVEKPGQSQTFDWPQWQGPERTGVSKETGLLKSWPAGGPALVWTAKGLGEGYSTPSVAAGRVYTMGNRGKTECIIAVDEDNGKLLWAANIGPVRHGGGGYAGPRCTPTVDGDLVYALGLNGDLLCVEALNGKEHCAATSKELPGSARRLGLCRIAPGGRRQAHLHAGAVLPLSSPSIKKPAKPSGKPRNPPATEAVLRLRHRRRRGRTTPIHSVPGQRCRWHRRQRRQTPLAVRSPRQRHRQLFDGGFPRQLRFRRFGLRRRRRTCQAH